MFPRPRAALAWSLFAAVLLLGVSAPRPFDAAPYVHSQRLVNIGGRRLNFYCTGSGSPTVVLDSDGDDSTVAWALVQPEVAKHTRVCSYDAAALGFSDPAPGPRDANAFVDDLHALLRSADVAPPYVIVGYSLSGLFDRLYADRFRTDLAGMVLVDPVVVGRGERLAALSPALRGAADNSGFISYLQTCEEAAAMHRLQPGTKIFDDCMWPTGPRDPHYPASVQHVLERQWQRPAAWKDMVFEAQANSADDAEIQHAQRSYGNLPVIVLSPDVRIDLKQFGLPRAQAEKVVRAYPAWEAEIAKYSSRGVAFVVSGSGHAIAEDRPNAVVSAIDEVVDQVRYELAKSAPDRR